jgi:hypothetical protein
MRKEGNMKRFWLTLALIFCATIPAFGQTRIPWKQLYNPPIGAITTVSGLSLWTIKGEIVSVEDGTSTSDCTVGGGSSVALCQYNGTSWAAFGSSAAGTYNQTLEANGTALPQQPAFNLIPSTGITISCINNSGSSRTDCTFTSTGGSMTWPSGGAGIPNYSGSSSWGTSYSTSNQIPADFISTLNQNTTGSAASLSISGQTGLLSFTGLASTNRVLTIRDASDTLLELGGNYTPTGTWNWITATVTWPTFNQSTTGNAGTATNLASYPTLCSGGQFSQGLSSGNNNCATPTGSGTVNAAPYAMAYYPNASSTAAVNGLAAAGYTGVPQVPTQVVGSAPTIKPQGLPGRTNTSTSDPVVLTDRGQIIYDNNSSAIARSLPQAGSTNFDQNFDFKDCNIGAGTVTITPTTSTIAWLDGGTYHSPTTSMPLLTGQCVFIHSPDNSNYVGLLGPTSSGSSGSTVYKLTCSNNGVPSSDSVTTELTNFATTCTNSSWTPAAGDRAVFTLIGNTSNNASGAAVMYMDPTVLLGSTAIKDAYMAQGVAAATTGLGWYATFYCAVVTPGSSGSVTCSVGPGTVAIVSAGVGGTNTNGGTNTASVNLTSPPTFSFYMGSNAGSWATGAAAPTATLTNVFAVVYH